MITSLLLTQQCASNSPTAHPAADAADTGADAVVADSPEEALSPLAKSGASYVNIRGCRNCHGADLAGNPVGLAPEYPKAFPKNLTPEPTTGLGNWTDKQIIDAIRTGIAPDDDGDLDEFETLCVMPVFKDMSDDEAKAIVAYLRSLPAIKRAVPHTVCPSP